MAFRLSANLLSPMAIDGGYGREHARAVLLHVPVEELVLEDPGIRVLYVVCQLYLTHTRFEILTVGEPDVG